MSTKPAKAETAQSQIELYLIALILKVGGHNITDAEVERAKTHQLTSERNSNKEIVLAAIPKT